jgi:HAD superfamily hydrolase (TIGR01509 family)
MAGFDAVIFDLDGVLVDTEIWWDEVRQAYAAAKERVWTLDDRAAVMGANSRQWSATMADRLRLATAPEEIEAAVVGGMVERYRGSASPLIAGADAAVRRLAGRYPLAVASSAHADVIRAALAATGLGDAFGVVVSSDEVAHGKPEPDVYLEASRRLGVPPSACLVVEDSLNGVLAAKRAGMTVVLVPNESVPPAPGATDAADVVLGRLSDLDPDAVAEAASTSAGRGAGR